MGTDFKKQLIFSFSIIGGSIVIFGIALYFLSLNLGLEASEIAADRFLVNQRSASIAALAGLKTDAPKASAYFEAMNKLLVPQDQLLDFPRWLDGLARARQIGINFSFSSGQTPPQGGLPGFNSFSLDLSGEMPSLINFFQDVEFRSPRFLVVIDNFDLTRSGSAHRILTSGKVYFR